MLVNLIVLIILGLQPEWRDDACDRAFASDGAKEWCENERDGGRAWAEQLARIIVEEAERQSLPADWITGSIAQESNFERGDICPMTLSRDRIVSREIIDAEAGREKMCWTYERTDDTDGKNCQPVLVLEESETMISLDRCAYGEMGVMQIRSHEARAGQIVPATGAPLPMRRSERHALLLDPQINISLGVAAMARVRDECCGTDEACRADPTQFWQAYNSGHCEAEHYVENVQAKIRRGMRYACEVDATMPGCTTSTP
jgi:hypothetical protein